MALRLKKILVMEDEPDMLTFLTTLLSAHGYQTAAAANGPACLKKIRSFHPDCIVLNAMMADDEGIRMYVDIKKDEHLSEIPVLIMSSLARKTFDCHPRFRGAEDMLEPDAYLAYPPDADELIGRIQDLIEKQVENRAENRAENQNMPGKKE